MRIALLVVGCALVLAACAGPSTHDRLAEMGGVSCSEASEFTCVSIEVPIDGEDRDRGTIEVLYAVRPASVSRHGVLVTAVGGPGGSGVEAAGWLADYFDDSIKDNYDLVFFDQRGVGLIEEPVCPETDDAGIFDESTDLDSEVDAISVYVDSCITESGHADAIPYLGTDHAIHDLEEFRRAMGYGRLTMYGRSYGNAFAQTYAAAYPGSVERMVLDAPVDLTVDYLASTKRGTAALQAILDAMFNECDSDPLCAADMEMPAAEAYQELIDELVEAPAIVAYPYEPDLWDEMDLTADDVGYLTFRSAYSADFRMLLLRAIAAHARDGDLVPMVRLFATSESDGIPTLLNVAVNCLDASIPGTTFEEEKAAVARAIESAPPQYRWSHESDSVCLAWPGRDLEREPGLPFVGDGIPVMVVAATMDPATPYPGAVSVFEALDDGYLLTINGGSHVMFGNGVSCVDDAVNTFIFAGTPPTSGCALAPVTLYLPLLPDEPDVVLSTEVLAAIDDELYFAPELSGADPWEPITVACNMGGAVTYAPTDHGVDLHLDRCSFNEHLTVSGRGSWDNVHGRTSLRVSFGDDGCLVTYERPWDDQAESLKESCLD